MTIRITQEQPSALTVKALRLALDAVGHEFDGEPTILHVGKDLLKCLDVLNHRDEAGLMVFDNVLVQVEEDMGYAWAVSYDGRVAFNVGC